MGNYEDRPLIEYLPDCLKEVREFQALMFGEQPEIFKLFDEIQRALNNEFVSSSAEYGVKRWETLLNIIPKSTDSLDMRKFAILSRLAEQLPYTYRKLEQILNTMCGQNGYKMALQSEKYELEILISLTIKQFFTEIRATLKRIVPANLVVRVELEYNRHITLNRFTHAFLGSFTHEGVRETPF